MNTQQLLLTNRIPSCNVSHTEKLRNLLSDKKWRTGKQYNDDEKNSVLSALQKSCRNDEIQITLVAFPFKIQNPLKTNSILPDEGEKIALLRLLELQKNLIDILSINLTWNIIMDGMYYADELCVEKDIVDQYSNAITTFSKQIGLHAKFFAMDEMIPNQNKKITPMSLDNDQEMPYVLRTAGMVNTQQFASKLAELFTETKSVSGAMKQLIHTNSEFRRQAERSAALYQHKKELIEQSGLFKTYFRNTVRASIQPDPNRNTKDISITRPLGIRITESNTKNLFPRLGVPCHKKENFCMFLADAKTQGFEQQNEIFLLPQKRTVIHNH